MTEAIIVALITAGAAVGAQLIISRREREARERTLFEQNSLVLQRLDALEAKVEKHNCLVERIYKTEADVSVLRQRLENPSVRS